ncbi:3-deoxy-manno-octulosonate cytidylyltransferase [Puniceibacterium sp. IMCC21224]|uniref:3-deoxy-manno-octulosonate cytidylyltransferase n=1 Tax=Puniceibacterium sp. IMCC21224 TaxID=1618204 RepID=UPI00064DE0F3|nr:manno-octulosonate cytidylyltransferase [Puniceibacterium sp. IMCC21224]KMK63973.1 CMP-2-keto-3-deoxyoctulosonic acid synthetase [Puniceibacterium sp. IMCC21224]
MKSVILIPARYASTRYPGKPLAELTLPDGTNKSLIRLSWEAAQQVRGVDAVYVATDDDRIADAARAFGAEVIMTSSDCRNGTERCADALEKAGIETDLVVNLQGDAPLTPPWFLEDLIAAMAQDDTAQVATPVLRCDATTYGHFIEDRRAGRVGGTTAVFGAQGHALYFSKEVIPYINPGALPDPIPVFHHVGVYAYRPAALRDYMGWASGPLEVLEGLEQLRFLENGVPVACVEVKGRGRVFWELNNPEDVVRINAALKEL